MVLNIYIIAYYKPIHYLSVVFVDEACGLQISAIEG